MDVHFVRANGPTLHDRKDRPECFVEGPSLAVGRVMNALPFCLANDIARIGWPDTGDLRRPAAERADARANCYTFDGLPQKTQQQLRAFAAIRVGDWVMVPDIETSGLLYAGQVTQPYSYVPGPPDPYEAAHRVSVRWFMDGNQPLRLWARRLGFRTSGWWLWAYHQLSPAEGAAVVRAIEGA